MNNNRIKEVIATTIVVGCLTIFFPVAGWLFAVICLATFLTDRMSVIERTVFSYLLFIGGNSLVFVLFNLMSFFPGIHAIGLIWVLSGFTLLIFRPRAAVTKTNEPQPLNLGLACLVLSVVSFVILIYPLHSPHNPLKALHFISYGEDNASHFALFKYGYLHDGYAYSNHINSGLLKSLETYPQVLHLNMSLLSKAILGPKASDNSLLHAYYYLNAMNFAVLVLVTSLLAVRFCRYRQKTTNYAVQSSGIVLLGMVLLILGPLFELFTSGFQPQIFSYVYLIALIYMVSFYEDFRSWRSILLISTLLYTAILGSWWFLAPIGLVPIFFLFFRTHARQPYTYLIALIMLGVSTYPIILGSIYSTDKQQINAGGGIKILSLGLVLSYLMTAALLLWSHKEVISKSRTLIATLIVSGLFAGLVALYQFSTIHELRYYFYKSVYTVVVLAAALALIATLIFLARLGSDLSPPQRLFATGILLCASLVFFMNYKPAYVREFLGDQLDSPPQAEFQPLFDAKKRVYSDVVYIGGCSVSETYVLNRWNEALHLSDNEWHARFNAATLANDNQKIINLLNNRPPSERNIFLQASNQCLSPAVQAAIKSNGIPSTSN